MFFLFCLQFEQFPWHLRQLQNFHDLPKNKNIIEHDKQYFSVASGGGTGRTLHPDNMRCGPASYGLTDTMVNSMSRNQLILFIIENLTVFSKTERRFFSWAVCCVEMSRTNEKSR